MSRDLKGEQLGQHLRKQHFREGRGARAEVREAGRSEPGCWRAKLSFDCDGKLVEGWEHLLGVI